MKRISPFLFPLISLGVVILLWHVVVKAGLLQELVMPSPWTVAKAFYKFFKEGEFFIHLWASFTRIITGFSIGAFFGVIFGILVGHFRLCGGLIYPFNSFEETYNTIRSVSIPIIPMTIIPTITFSVCR